MHVAVAFAHFMSGRYDEALAEAETAVRGQLNFFVGTCVAAASAALAGKPAQAEKAMARVRELNPNLRLSNLKNFLVFRRSADFDRWYDGLRKAGLPD
jgi:hypothetical protein